YILSLHCIFISHAPSAPDIYTLSLHDALPISRTTAGAADNASDKLSAAAVTVFFHVRTNAVPPLHLPMYVPLISSRSLQQAAPRSEEHTSELQSRENLVCRLLLEKKKNKTKIE